MDNIAKRTYCFDLDHTLIDTQKHPTQDRWDYLNAAPIQNRIGIVNELYKQGHKIIINTARGTMSGKDWTEDTMLQLDVLGLKYHELHCGVKPVADFYVDDKGVRDFDFFDD